MNDKTYIRIGRRFVPTPDKSKLVGKYLNEDYMPNHHIFLSEYKTECTKGIIVDVKDNNIIVARENSSECQKTYNEALNVLRMFSNDYIPTISELIEAIPHLRKMYPKFYGQMWSSTPKYTNSNSFVFSLGLGSGYCGVYYDGVDSDYLFTQYFYKIPIEKFLKYQVE